MRVSGESRRAARRRAGGVHHRADREADEPVALARRLGLSSAAVTKAARPLIEAGCLYELGATERSGPGAGRPASPLAAQPDREFFVGRR